MSWLERAPFVMQCHKYWSNGLNRTLPVVRYEGIELSVSPDTCKPLYGEIQLVRDVKSGDRVLDLGTGSGIIAIAAAKKGAMVDAVDVSRSALNDCRRNVEKNGVEGSVAVWSSDGFSEVRDRYDWIFAHLPYVELEGRKEAPNHVWAAASPNLVERVLQGVGEHLRSTGTFRLVWPKAKQGRVAALARENGLELIGTEALAAPASLRWQRVLYLNTGFESTAYDLRREDRPEAHDEVPHSV